MAAGVAARFGEWVILRRLFLRERLEAHPLPTGGGGPGRGGVKQKDFDGDQQESWFFLQNRTKIRYIKKSLSVAKVRENTSRALDQRHNP